MWYLSMLFAKRRILKDQAALDREASSNFPMIGHLIFLFEGYKPEFCES